MADFDPETMEDAVYAPNPYPSGQWEASVELRLKRVTLIAYGDAAIAIGAIALGLLAFKGLTNLTKGVMEMGQMVQGTAQAVFGNPAVPNVPPKPTKVDETVVGTEEYKAQGNDVAEPIDLPATEVPDAIKELLEQDLIDPSQIGKGPEL